MAYSSIKRKTPLKKSQKPLNRSPLKKGKVKIAKVANKRAQELRQYHKDRIVFLEQNPVCCGALEGCTKAATEVHHGKGRENWRLLDKSEWRALCRNCHDIITVFSKVGFAKGLSSSKHKQDENSQSDSVRGGGDDSRSAYMRSRFRDKLGDVSGEGLEGSQKS